MNGSNNDGNSKLAAIWMAEGAVRAKGRFSSYRMASHSQNGQGRIQQGSSKAFQAEGITRAKAPRLRALPPDGSHRGSNEK